MVNVQSMFNGIYEATRPTCGHSPIYECDFLCGFGLTWIRGRSLNPHDRNVSHINIIGKIPWTFAYESLRISLNAGYLTCSQGKWINEINTPIMTWTFFSSVKLDLFISTSASLLSLTSGRNTSMQRASLLWNAQYVYTTCTSLCTSLYNVQYFYDLLCNAHLGNNVKSTQVVNDVSSIQKCHL